MGNDEPLQDAPHTVEGVTVTPAPATRRAVTAAASNPAASTDDEAREPAGRPG